jgi:hypothetical protein
VRVSSPETVGLARELDAPDGTGADQSAPGRQIVAASAAEPAGTPAAGAPIVTAARYALINIQNNTRSVMAFEFRWGTGTWQTRSIDPRTSRNFWWEYPSGSTVSPTFYLRRGSTTYALRRYAADQIDVAQAARYEFYADGLFRATDGEVFPGDWARVAWFLYGNWAAGMYVGGVRVERFMGPQGYNWNYRVQVVDVSLSSGLPCVPGQHWEGLVRARVTSPQGGYLDTGDMAVHSSGGTKEQSWAAVNPGDINNCTLWRQTWCEW